jgi:starch synthase
VRIAFITAELSPIVSVGGLAAAAAGLVAELRRQGVDVDVVLPDYGPASDGVALVDERVDELTVPDWVGPAYVRTGVHPVAGEVHLIDVDGLARSHPYVQADGEGWPDNPQRFFAFSRAAAAFVARTRPDVVHVNDWHTGTVLAALADPPPSVLSLHNLAHQGHAPGSWLGLLGPRAEHFEWWGGVNALTGAIALADAVVAVSPHYATEILTPEGGFGVDLALRMRGEAVLGILNGIDTHVWDPADDAHLAESFGSKDLAGRAANRVAVLERCGLPVDDVPLATVVTRLTDQKGVDLIEPLVPVLGEIPLRIAVLGSGDAAQAARLHGLAATYPDRFAFVEGYDEQLSHRMFAGADLYLMPSRFEPCGLTQMQAMRYGAIPIVTAVGGLVDTVIDVDAEPRNGTGFVAARADTVHLLAAVFRASRRIADKRRREAIAKRGMAIDWSWHRPAQQYIDLYGRVQGHG